MKVSKDKISTKNDKGLYDYRQNGEFNLLP